ncbi:helix-turn-helix domain-containing protein [Stieleria varia]|uniref:DNA primase n=1 Tax=Stieleria varia TaxID=2528005 RepID=A0A5C5ZIM3_9BACT|nr:DNA primase [Stieleria varia]TWT86965.1 hypothetical protein Pla52n_70650 [Stieleria varia]
MNDHELHAAIHDDPIAFIADYYASRLSDNPKVLEHLQANALHCDDLHIGFSDRTFGKLLPPHRSKAGRDLREMLQSVGVLKSTGHETFRGFVTVPLTDTAGKITGIHGRRVDRSQGDEMENTIGTGIFNAAALTTFDELIVCGCILDAWTFCAAGHRNAVVAEQLNDEYFKGIKRLLIASPEINLEHFTDLEILQIAFPGHDSVNAYAKAHLNETDPLASRIRAATWVSGKPTQHAVVQQPVASPTPNPVDDLDIAQSDNEITIRIEHRRYRVRGLQRNTTPGTMKINLMVFNDRNDQFHVDTLDLCHARSRRVFLKECGEEIAIDENTLRGDIGRILLKLDQLQADAGTKSNEPPPYEMTDTERSEAMDLLQSPKLLDRILDDFETCGIVGEHAGKLAGYLAATSRLLDKPLGLIIQSSSAAGKSALSDSILRFMPPESRFTCSAMTSQSLYYFGKESLKHKILSVAEEEGVRDASYQLKLLQSEGRLSLISTSKEAGSGRTATERYEVEGPVALIMTTTSMNVDPELLNRCLVIAIDESVAQTAAILQQQRFAETVDGFIQEMQGKEIVKNHQNAQRLLRRLPVYNPYAEQLGFIGTQARHRRDHRKYLSLIKAVALLYQFQHETKTIEIEGESIQYIEVTREDIAKANTIADWALGRSIDELSGPTRRLLIELYDWLYDRSKTCELEPTEIVFNRREAREALGWSATQLNYHLERLCRDEYVVRQGGDNGKLCRYSVLYDGRGREGQAALIGLVDAASLQEPTRTAPTTTDLSG